MNNNTGLKMEIIDTPIPKLNHVPLGRIHYVLPGGEGFLGDTRIFRSKLGDWKFSTDFWGMSNFPLILINSVGLYYKLICHLPEIFNTKDAN